MNVVIVTKKTKTECNHRVKNWEVQVPVCVIAIRVDAVMELRYKNYVERESPLAAELAR